MGNSEKPKHQFILYNLEIVVNEINGNCTCSMAIGDKFYLKGGKFSLPENKDFCVYALQSTLPLLPAKQRKNHPNDWMETDSKVSCPDPACQLIMKINRIGEQTFNQEDVSATNL